MEGLKTMIVAHVTHYSAELYCNGVRFAAVPGAVGKETTKNINHKTRDKLFNDYLARAWLKKIEAGETPLAAAYEELKKNEK
jgi:hypothetical protein